MGFGHSHAKKRKLIRRVRSATREARHKLAHREGKEHHDTPGHHWQPGAHHHADRPGAWNAFHGLPVGDNGPPFPDLPLAGRAHHIHARVGCEQGPQVPHPAAPEYQEALTAHERWWTQILAEPVCARRGGQHAHTGIRAGRLSALPSVHRDAGWEPGADQHLDGGTAEAAVCKTFRGCFTRRGRNPDG